jgi:hypothetical protein
MSTTEIIRRAVVAGALAAGSATLVSAEANGKTGVQLVVKEADRRVDVLVDGKPVHVLHLARPRSRSPCSIRCARRRARW